MPMASMILRTFILRLVNTKSWMFAIVSGVATSSIRLATKTFAVIHTYQPTTKFGKLHLIIEIEGS